MRNRFDGSRRVLDLTQDQRIVLSKIALLLRLKRHQKSRDAVAELLDMPKKAYNWAENGRYYGRYLPEIVEYLSFPLPLWMEKDFIERGWYYTGDTSDCIIYCPSKEW